jgi:hypothetical protein
LATRDFGRREELTIQNIRSSFSSVEIVVVTPIDIPKSKQNKLNIKLCKDNRKGIHAAYNLGAASATGDFIFFAGSGDIYTHNAGKIINREMRRNPGADIYGFGSVWARWKNFSAQFGDVRQDSHWNSGVLVSGLPVSHQAMFYNRESFLKVGFLDEDLKTSSDYKHLADAFLKGLRMNISDECVAIVDNGGISSNQGNLVVEEHVAIVNENLKLGSPTEAEEVFRAGKGWLGIESVSALTPEIYLMIENAHSNQAGRTKLRRLVILLFRHAVIF